MNSSEDTSIHVSEDEFTCLRPGGDPENRADVASRYGLRVADEYIEDLELALQLADIAEAISKERLG